MLQLSPRSSSPLLPVAPFSPSADRRPTSPSPPHRCQENHTDAETDQRLKLSKIGMDAVFSMVFMNNFVHADLHPGYTSHVAHRTPHIAHRTTITARRQPVSDSEQHHNNQEQQSRTTSRQSRLGRFITPQTASYRLILDSHD